MNLTLKPVPPRPDPRERRRYPRIAVDCEVDILTSDRENIRTRMIDLSREGMQLRCDRSALAALLPLKADFGPRADEMDAHLVVRLESGPLVIAGHCRRRYMQKVGEDEVCMGFEFMELDPPSRARLDAFIERCLEPE